MIEPASDRRPPITPQLAVRVAIFGAIALGLFAIVFFRLWYLQVLSGEQYLAQANSNRVRTIPIQAPRGKIVDASGKEIVVNKRAAVIEIDPSKLPQSERDLAAEWGKKAGEREARPKGSKGAPVPIPGIQSTDLRARYERLGEVLDLPANSIHRRVVRSLVLVPYSSAVVKTDVRASVLSYIRERPEEFPGVKVDETFLRDYPRGKLAAQILGYAGQVGPDELSEKRNRGLKQGAIVGKDGLERAYDKYLRGENGSRRVQVDADGRPVANRRLRDKRPVSGKRLRLSLDLSLQRAARDAISGPLNPGSNPGAFVALDLRDGKVLAMGSNPTFDPALFTKPITQARFDALRGVDGGPAPLTNRAISGAYPSASTFKPISALAGLDTGIVTPSTTINDTGCAMIADIERCNAEDAEYGAVDLTRALQVSSDLYFYKLGVNTFLKNGEAIQSWARKLGLDRTTGIDLPGEFSGVIPGKKWRRDINQAELACREKKKISQTTDVFRAAAMGCGLSDLREFSEGDSASLATGQGDVQATPLQMAVAYAAIANGGKVVTPHLGLEVQSPSGELVQRIETDPARKVDIDPTDLGAVREGLRLAASTPEGTSGAVFAGWDHGRYPVYGKTGTAERPPKADQSWYVAYVPDPKRPIVVAVTVEEGGFGSEVAAPITCRILAGYYKQDASACSTGTAPQ
ncbi:MAG: penicillin-binding transpeptidase domain-containing protein [Solirubrobacteraceae bacterium]